MTSPALKQPTRPPLYSVSFIRVYGKVVKVILETQAARNLRSTTVSTVAVAQLLDRAATRPGVQVLK